MYFPRRYVLMVLIFFGGVIDKFIRVALSMAIIPISRSFGWDESTEGLVLAAFFIGYIPTMMYASSISMRFGGKLTAGLALAGGCPFVMAFPFVARYVPAAVAMQLLCGLSHSFFYPAIYQLLANWFPKHEKSRGTAIMGAGGTSGMLLSWGISPLIIESFGWESLFFISGGAGLVWLAPWLLFTLDGPDSDGISCCSVSSEEIEYIKYSDLMNNGNSTGNPDSKPNSNSQATGNTSGHVPWKRILTSPAIILLTWVQFVCNWIFYIWMSWLPSYYEYKYQLKLTKVGIYSMIPMGAYIFALLSCGYAADKIIQNKILSVIAVRKIFQTIVFVPIIAAHLILSFVPLDLTTTVVAVIAAFSALGAGAGGKDASFFDLTPKYSSSLFAFANMVGSFPGVVGVYFTGFILEKTRNNWAVIFLLSAGMALSAWLPWIFCARVTPIDFDAENDEEPMVTDREKGTHVTTEEEYLLPPSKQNNSKKYDRV